MMKLYILLATVLISALVLARQSVAESVTTSTQTTTTSTQTTTTPDKSGDYTKTVTTLSETTGAAVYKKYCVSCHGNDGKGNLKMASMLKTRMPNLIKDSVKKSDQELIKIIIQGQGKMPAYKNKLTREEQIASLTYIRTMAAREAEKTSPAAK